MFIFFYLHNARYSLQKKTVVDFCMFYCMAYAFLKLKTLHVRFSIFYSNLIKEIFYFADVVQEPRWENTVTPSTAAPLTEAITTTSSTSTSTSSTTPSSTLLTTSNDFPGSDKRATTVKVLRFILKVLVTVCSVRLYNHSSN